MAELEIPDRALMCLDYVHGIDQAARIIVATELRRIANSDECWCYRCICDRADELDPPCGS